METINFLFKVKKHVNNRTKENRYLVKIYNPLMCDMETLYFYDEDLIKGYSLSESIKHHLQLSKKFNFNHYVSYFCDADSIGF